MAGPMSMHATPLAGYGWILQIVLVALIALVIWWILRSNRQGYASKDTPLEILQKRLAKGEINEKEYRRLKKELGR